MSADILQHEHQWFKNPDSKSGAEFCRECLVKKPAEQFKRVCAWCKKTLEDAPEGAPVSHGICESCAANVSKGTGRMRSFLLLALLAFSSVGCNSLRKLTGEDNKNADVPAGFSWVVVGPSIYTGSYTTNQNNKTTVGEPCFSSLDVHQVVGSNSFTGELRDSCLGYNLSNVTGTVSPSAFTFKMHVVNTGSYCPGSYDITGTIPHSANSAGGNGFEFLTVSGSDCLGSYTSISGGEF